MPQSALMKSGIISDLDWYPINPRGLQIWSQLQALGINPNLSIWEDFRQLLSTLDTTRYSMKFRPEKGILLDYREPGYKPMDAYGLFQHSLNLLNAVSEFHPKNRQLWRFMSRQPQLTD